MSEFADAPQPTSLEHETQHAEATQAGGKMTDDAVLHAGVEAPHMEAAAAVGPSELQSMSLAGAVAPAAEFPPSPGEVAQAQADLDRLGYCAGAPDGIVGFNTANATAEFQEINGLPVTGQLDSLTRADLESPEAIPNPLPCGAWDGPPIEVEGPGGIIFIGEGHLGGHGGWGYEHEHGHDHGHGPDHGGEHGGDHGGDHGGNHGGDHGGNHGGDHGGNHGGDHGGNHGGDHGGDHGHGG